MGGGDIIIHEVYFLIWEADSDVPDGGEKVWLSFSKCNFRFKVIVDDHVERFAGWVDHEQGIKDESVTFVW